MNSRHINFYCKKVDTSGSWIRAFECGLIEEEEEEVYLPRHRFVKARGHPPQTLQKYRIAFATSHKAPEQIHKLLF